MRITTIFTACIPAFLSALPVGPAWSNGGSMAVSHRDWEDRCDEHSCIATNSEGITIFFDDNGGVLLTLPATKRQMNTLRATKVELPDGLFMLSPVQPNWDRMTLTVQLTPQMRGDLAERDYVTVNGIGNISIVDFGGFYQIAATKLGLDDAKKAVNFSFDYTPPAPLSDATLSRPTNSANKTGFTAKVERQIGMTDAYDVICRGSSGNEKATMTACQLRDEGMEALNSLGVCYGKEDEPTYLMQWHQCGEDSDRTE